MVNVDSTGRFCVQPDVVYMPHRIHLNSEKTHTLNHTELPCKLFLKNVKKRMLTFTVLNAHMLVSKMYWQTGCLCLHTALSICKCPC